MSSFSVREARFVQSSEDGIEFYPRESVASFVKQFEACRRSSMTEILTLLEYDLSQNEANLAKYWKSAKTRFFKNAAKLRDALKHGDGHDFPDECHIAMILYTLGYEDGSIYFHLNADSRNSCGGYNSLEDIRNLSIFLLIRYVMENKAASTEPSFLYRGCRGAPVSKVRNGQLIGFGQFTSTTTEAGKDTIFSGGAGGTFFVIVNSSTVPTKLIPLKSHSEYPSENEVLLSPFQLYEVCKIEKKSGVNYVYLNLY